MCGVEGGGGGCGEFRLLKGIRQYIMYTEAMCMCDVHSLRFTLDIYSYRWFLRTGTCNMKPQNKRQSYITNSKITFNQSRVCFHAPVFIAFLIFKYSWRIANLQTPVSDLIITKYWCSFLSRQLYITVKAKKIVGWNLGVFNFCVVENFIFGQFSSTFLLKK